MRVQTDDRFAHIDCLRAIGALAVAFHHLFPRHANGVTEMVSRLDGFVDLGRFGVDVFFIVSGWVIPFSLMSSGGGIAAFAVNRAFRLYPMYWVALTVLVTFFDTSQPAAKIAANYSLLHRFSGIPDILGLCWTLQIELAFYALSAALFAAGLLQRAGIVAAVVAGLAAWHGVVGLVVLAGGPLLPIGWPTFLALMFGGTLIRFADQGMIRRPIAVWLVFSLVPARLLASLAVAGFHWADWPKWLAEFLPVALAVAAFLIVDHRKVLRWRPLAWMGTISYSIYLLHTLVAEAVGAGLRALSLTLDPLLTGGVVLAATVLCSWASFVLIEAPFIRIGRRLAAPASALKPAKAIP